MVAINELMKKVSRAQHELDSALEELRSELEVASGERVSIYDIGLSNRTRNALVRANIRTKDELALTPDAELLELRHFGQACLAEVKAVLNGEPKPEKVQREPYVARLHLPGDDKQTLCGFTPARRVSRYTYVPDSDRLKSICVSRQEATCKACIRLYDSANDMRRLTAALR